MKTNVSYYDFKQAFAACDRIDQFTPMGLILLYDFLIEMEEDTGEEWDLDVIALCCDFYEETAEDIAENYSVELPDGDDVAEVVSEYLMDNTMFVGSTDAGTMLYQAF